MHKLSEAYLSLPENERAVLHLHYSRMGRKGGSSIPKDVRSRAAKKGALKRMQTLAANKSNHIPQHD